MKAKRAVQEPDSCIIYCRVSTLEQAEEGVSLDVQERLCREHAERKGWRVLHSYRDAGISGQKDETKRPGLASVLEACRARPDAIVVVYSLSRLARTQRMTWRLLDDRGDYRLLVSSVTEPFDTTTAMGKAVLGMLAIWNQLEADLSSDRTKAALAHIMSQGGRIGSPSMTECHNGEGYVPDPRRIAIIRQVQEIKAETGLPLRQLAVELERRGIASVTGHRWHPRTLRIALAANLDAQP